MAKCLYVYCLCSFSHFGRIEFVSVRSVCLVDANSGDTYEWNMHRISSSVVFFRAYLEFVRAQFSLSFLFWLWPRSRLRWCPKQFFINFFPLKLVKLYADFSAIFGSSYTTWLMCDGTSMQMTQFLYHRQARDMVFFLLEISITYHNFDEKSIRNMLVNLRSNVPVISYLAN